MFCVVPFLKKFKVNIRRYHNLSRPQTNTDQSGQFWINAITHQTTVNTSENNYRESISIECCDCCQCERARASATFTNKSIKKMATETAETWNRSIFFSLRTLMHIIAAVQIIIGLYYDFNYVYPPPDHSHYEPLKSFGKFGKFRFLTILNAVCMMSLLRLSFTNLHNFQHNQLKMICWTKFIDFFLAFYRFGKQSILLCALWTILLEQMNFTRSDHQLCVNSKTMYSLRSHSRWLSMLPFHSGAFMQLIVNWFYPNRSTHSFQCKCWAELCFQYSLIWHWLILNISQFFRWLNHIMHTNVALFIVMELFVTFRQYPSRKIGITSLTIFMLGYVIWIHVIKHVSGKWVYPILEVLEMPQRMTFMAFIFIFCISFYFVGEYLNNTVWAKEIKTTKKQK